MKDRVYICHTYYHAYVSFLKELKLRADGDKGEATILLSTMSCKFENLAERLLATGVFAEAYTYEEQPEENFPELAKWHVNTGSFVHNMYNRIRLTKAFGKKQEPFIPVNLKEYKEVIVFCDSDPIGFYLNYAHIPYHAMEDGLNCLHNYDSARYDNRGHFGIKTFFSKKLNLIFIQNGYGKYCIDMEVDNRSLLKYDAPFYVECSRKSLTERLTDEDKKLLVKGFVRDPEMLTQKLAESEKCGKRILLLTDPLCEMEIREQIFRDLLEKYSKEGTVFLKPHPRDTLNYREKFPEVAQFDATVPMELLNYMPYAHFDKAVTVLTMIGAIEFADEVERLGESFMDKYEDYAVHHQNEYI